jgi:uncharacterized protein YbjT (DUF2867 family)/uncharacterized membrane protein YphA (DoxX/SURF4 family)
MGLALNVLLTGGTGFIGHRLAEVLGAQGIGLRLASRRPRPRTNGVTYVAADFANDHDPEAWTGRLEGIDVIVNAVGIFRESPGQRFEDLHVRAPIALFEAGRRVGVRRIIQISALGAHADAATAFLRSKAQADASLLSSTVPAVVVRPSIVYGPGGTSAAWFDTLASLPLTPLPGHGTQWLQPIHLDDLAAVVCHLVQGKAFIPGILPAVGAHPVTLAQLLASLRAQMRLGELRAVPVPAGCVKRSLAIAGRFPGVPWNLDAWTMLSQGNTAPVDETRRVLGRTPRPVAAFIPSRHAGSARNAAVLSWVRPLLRMSLATVWIVTAITSLWIFPRDQSMALLARVGLHGDLATVALYLGAGLDLLFGVTTLIGRWPRQWLLQAALIAGYTVLITLWLPEYWSHPYGPVLKNLPILVILAWLHATEDPHAASRPPAT